MPVPEGLAQGGEVEGRMSYDLKTLDCPKIKVQDTKGTSLAIQFDHLDVSGEDWIAAFKLIMAFLAFGPKTIGELFNDEQEELFNTEED